MDCPIKPDFFFFKFAEMRWNSFIALEPSISHVQGRYHIPLLWQIHDFALCLHQRTGLPLSPYAPHHPQDCQQIAFVLQARRKIPTVSCCPSELRAGPKQSQLPCQSCFLSSTSQVGLSPLSASTLCSSCPLTLPFLTLT